MNLRFDLNKMPEIKTIKSSEEVAISVQVQFRQPSTATGKTEIELREHVNRIGGFDAEKIDSETLRIVTSF